MQAGPPPDLKRLRRELEWVARRLPMAEDLQVREALFDQIKLVQHHIDVLIQEDQTAAPVADAAQLLHARAEVEHILNNLAQLVDAQCVSFPAPAPTARRASEP